MRDGGDTIRSTGVFVVMMMKMPVEVVVEEEADPHPLSGNSSIHSSGF